MVMLELVIDRGRCRRIRVSQEFGSYSVRAWHWKAQRTFVERHGLTLVEAQALVAKLVFLGDRPWTET